MNKLKINGYRLYGDAELVFITPPEDLIGSIFSEYMSPPHKTIELTCNNCKFNKGNQAGKIISDSIEVSFKDYNGDTYSGFFLVNWLNTKDKISFNATAMGAITLTLGDL